MVQFSSLTGALWTSIQSKSSQQDLQTSGENDSFDVLSQHYSQRTTMVPMLNHRTILVWRDVSVDRMQLWMPRAMMMMMVFLGVERRRDLSTWKQVADKRCAMPLILSTRTPPVTPVNVWLGSFAVTFRPLWKQK